jgi:hypothetical protein
MAENGNKYSKDPGLSRGIGQPRHRTGSMLARTTPRNIILVLRQKSFYALLKATLT